MLAPWILLFFSLIYIGILFVIAHIGDKQSTQTKLLPYKSVIYSLSLAVYCTSWTYYGAVGNASTRGWEFIAIYLGPILIFVFGHRFLKRIANICIENNITTIADFISSRYGKAQNLAVLVTVIAILGTLPYIALQLKAVASSYEVIASYATNKIPFEFSAPFLKDTGLVVAIIMAIFSIIFGTRYVNASENHEGIILAIAFESVVKLFALICVCIFTVYFVFDGPRDILNQASNSQKINNLLFTPELSKDFFQLTFISNLILATAAIFCLPRQFHVAFVEVDKTKDMEKSRWVFPVYLAITSLVVIPIAISGLLLFEDKHVIPDMFVLTIPILANNEFMTLLVFIGGFSAATSMVIIAVITLSTMICNDIIMPVLFKIPAFKLKQRNDISSILLLIRRLAIIVILILSYYYYRYISAFTTLASIGLVSFVAAIQFAPAIIGGIYWKKGNKRGATSGLIAGFIIWLYSLFLPAIAGAGWFPTDFIYNGLWGINYLKPYALFGLDNWTPITHALILSLTANIGCYIYFSLAGKPNLLGRIQAAKFTQTEDQKSPSDGLPWWSTVAVGELRLLAEKIIGEKATRLAFSEYAQKHPEKFIASRKADADLIRFTERLLAGAIGASSARLLIGSVLNKKDLPIEDVFSIVDEASQAVHFSQELLNNTIEHIDQGISVVDKDLNLIAWNSRYVEIYNYPDYLIKIGRPITEILAHNERASELSQEEIRAHIEQRLEHMRQGKPHSYLRYRKDGTVIHIQGKPMANVGYVTSFTDVTELKRTEQELRKINENLEKIVEGRTIELSNVNQELENAIISKNQFLAAVNHDVMQPLNAARLFSSALAQRSNDQTGLSDKINNSIRSAEEIIHTLLAISKLDSGAMTTNITTFCINDVMQTLHDEFSLIAADRKIKLRCIFSSLGTTSDAHLVRRILQNFISNALRHTPPGGRVTIGCRRQSANQGKTYFTVEVHDTGVGINPHDQTVIFEEFKRLDNQIDENQKGIGLGLAISKRISKLLGLRIFVKSKLNTGSIFMLRLEKADLTQPVKSITTSQSVSNKSYTDISGFKILCIDNDTNVLNAMDAQLDVWQCDTVSASNYDQAILKMKELEFVPELLLVDYHLDNDNGVSTVSKLHDYFKRCIPAAIISADSSAQIKQKAKLSGARYLNKPVNPAALRKLIFRSVKKQPAGLS